MPTYRRLSASRVSETPRSRPSNTIENEEDAADECGFRRVDDFWDWANGNYMRRYPDRHYQLLTSAIDDGKYKLRDHAFRRVWDRQQSILARGSFNDYSRSVGSLTSEETAAYVLWEAVDDNERFDDGIFSRSSDTTLEKSFTMWSVLLFLEAEAEDARHNEREVERARMAESSDESDHDPSHGYRPRDQSSSDSESESEDERPRVDLCMDLGVTLRMSLSGLTLIEQDDEQWCT